MTASPARSPPIQPTLTSLHAVTQIAPNLQLPVCLTDSDGNGYISCNELNDLFKAACLPLPGYRVREIIENMMATGDLDKDGKISFDEFIKVRSKEMHLKCGSSIRKTSRNTFLPSLLQHCLFFPLWFSQSQVGFLKIHYVFAGFSWPEKRRRCQDL